MLLSSMEGLAMLLFVFKIFFTRGGVIKFFTIIFSNPVVFYCIIFSLLFAVFVGISTFNFGSLVRYKIPCMPFFVVALIIIHSKVIASKKEESKVNL
jgi:hypothetical protein